MRIFSFLCSFIRHTKRPYLAKTFKKRPIFRKLKESKDCSLMINVSAIPLSLIYQKCERRSAHRSQLKIWAPLLQSLPACERSLRAEHKRATLINALLKTNYWLLFLDCMRLWHSLDYQLHRSSVTGAVTNWPRGVWCRLVPMTRVAANAAVTWQLNAYWLSALSNNKEAKLKKASRNNLLHQLGDIIIRLHLIEIMITF